MTQDMHDFSEHSDALIKNHPYLFVTNPRSTSFEDYIHYFMKMHDSVGFSYITSAVYTLDSLKEYKDNILYFNGVTPSREGSGANYLGMLQVSPKTHSCFGLYYTPDIQEFLVAHAFATWDMDELQGILTKLTPFKKSFDKKGVFGGGNKLVGFGK